MLSHGCTEADNENLCYYCNSERTLNNANRVDTSIPLIARVESRYAICESLLAGATTGTWTTSALMRSSDRRIPRKLILLNRLFPARLSKRLTSDLTYLLVSTVSLEASPATIVFICVLIEQCARGIYYFLPLGLLFLPSRCRSRCHCVLLWTFLRFLLICKIERMRDTVLAESIPLHACLI